MKNAFSLKEYKSDRHLMCKGTNYLGNKSCRERGFYQKMRF